jgi:hypothetical protein
VASKLATGKLATFTFTNNQNPGARPANAHPPSKQQPNFFYMSRNYTIQQTNLPAEAMEDQPTYRIQLPWDGYLCNWLDANDLNWSWREDNPGAIVEVYFTTNDNPDTYWAAKWGEYLDYVNDQRMAYEGEGEE